MRIVGQAGAILVKQGLVAVGVSTVFDQGVGVVMPVVAPGEGQVAFRLLPVGIVLRGLHQVLLRRTHLRGYRLQGAAQSIEVSRSLA